MDSPGEFSSGCVLFGCCKGKAALLLLGAREFDAEAELIASSPGVVLSLVRSGGWTLDADVDVTATRGIPGRVSRHGSPNSILFVLWSNVLIN